MVDFNRLPRPARHLAPFSEADLATARANYLPGDEMADQAVDMCLRLDPDRLRSLPETLAMVALFPAVANALGGVKASQFFLGLSGAMARELAQDMD